jgi:hypothetical protein
MNNKMAGVHGAFHSKKGHLLVALWRILCRFRSPIVIIVIPLAIIWDAERIGITGVGSAGVFHQQALVVRIGPFSKLVHEVAFLTLAIVYRSRVEFVWKKCGVTFCW